MPNQFYDHHRIVEIADRAALLFDQSDNPDTVLTDLLEQLHDKIGDLQSDLEFVQAYTETNHFPTADQYVDDEDEDDPSDTIVSLVKSRAGD